MKNIINRCTQRTITREIIGGLPGKELAWALWEYIWLKVGKEYKRLSQVLETLPPGFCVIYHLFVLDGEIANGGFNQYFFNGTDADAQHQSDALRLIGARKHQKVLRKAFKLHDKERGSGATTPLCGGNFGIIF